MLETLISQIISHGWFMFLSGQNVSGREWTCYLRKNEFEDIRVVAETPRECLEKAAEAILKPTPWKKKIFTPSDPSLNSELMKIFKAKIVRRI